MKSPDKFVDEIISLFKHHDLSKNVSKTPTGFILEQKNPDWVCILFLCGFIPVPAMMLLYSDFSVENAIISLIWVVFNGYSLYNTIVADNRVELDFIRRTVEIHTLNVLTKHLFRSEIVAFEEVECIQIKSVHYGSVGNSSSRLVLKTKNKKGYALNEYKSDHVARKLKFAIECLTSEKRNTNSPYKVHI
ncbi:hypothetical protein [Pontibacter russatus]|uniref:hypothetical protein n=1 Tax=Pontibacter russatus TaxID=2694929 RepID=UPI00137B0EE2|nr:hypothetical protein [Pontibacter russatus]